MPSYNGAGVMQYSSGMDPTANPKASENNSLKPQQLTD